MNDQPQPSAWQRSSTRRALAWLTTGRGLRRILIVLAWAATLIALLYAEENWRGRRAWNKYRQELERRGSQIDFKALLPKPVPDDQNFAATPAVQAWFRNRTNQPWNDNYHRVEGKVSSTGTSTSKGARHLTDLKAWAAAMEAAQAGKKKWDESDSAKFHSRSNAAPVVLDGLKASEPILAELRAASSRPHAVYPIDYTREDPWAILLPHLPNVRAACQRLQLKASAQLAMGRSGDALHDIKLIVYLADSLKEEPFLVSYLVRLACVQHAIHAIWEGLAEDRWSEPQLQELQTRLQRYNFFADMERPVAAEHAAGVLTADLIRQKGANYLFALGSPQSTELQPSATAHLLAWLVPSGWYYQEKVNYSRLFYMQRQAIAVEGTKARVLPTRVNSGLRDLERGLAGSAGDNRRLGAFLNHRVVAALLLPALGRISLKAAGAQTAVEQAAIACALERHKLARGSYPNNLEALVPEFISKLPPDPITGESYKYRTESERFVLYSVGWNEKDDGGKTGRNLFDEQEGDWVWSY